MCWKLKGSLCAECGVIFSGKSYEIPCGARCPHYQCVEKIRWREGKGNGRCKKCKEEAAKKQAKQLKQEKKERERKEKETKKKDVKLQDSFMRNPKTGQLCQVRKRADPDKKGTSGHSPTLRDLIRGTKSKGDKHTGGERHRSRHRSPGGSRAGNLDVEGNHEMHPEQEVEEHYESPGANDGRAIIVAEHGAQQQ